MTTRILATLSGEGYSSPIELITTDAGVEIVRFKADLDVDADGSNGQHGGPVAYRVDDTGRDRLANIGYPHSPEEYRQGLICNLGGHPMQFMDHQGKPFFASRTSLRMPGAVGQVDPSIGVDGEYFPFVVLPPVIFRETKGKVLGCRCVVHDTRTGRECETVVADGGPSRKDGEGSPALCRALGIPDSPLSGGVDEPVLLYTVFVGVPAVVNGFTFALQSI